MCKEVQTVKLQNVSTLHTSNLERSSPPQPGTLLRLMSLISSEFQCSAVQCSVPCSPSVIWSLWEQKQYIINIVWSCYTEGCFRMSEEANDKVIHIHRQDFMEKLGIGDHLMSIMIMIKIWISTESKCFVATLFNITKTVKGPLQWLRLIIFRRKHLSENHL